MDEELDLSFVDDLSVDDLLNVGPDDVDGLELSDGGPPLHEFEELFFGTAATATAAGGACGEQQQCNIPNYYNNNNNNNYVPYRQNNMDYLQLEHPSYHHHHHHGSSVGGDGAAAAGAPPPYHHVHPHHAHTPSPPPLLFRSHDYESHHYNNCYSMDTFHHHAHAHAQQHPYYPRVEQEQSRTITPVHVESSSTKQEEGNANNSSILIKEEKDHNDNKNNVLVPTADESRESRRQRIQKMVDNKRGLYQRRMNTYIASTQTSTSASNNTDTHDVNLMKNSHYYYLMSPEATASAVSAALDISPSQIHDEDVANIAFGLVKNLAQANVQQAKEKKTSTSATKAKAKAKDTEDKPKGKGKARGRSRSIARKKNTSTKKETKAKTKENQQDTSKATTAETKKKKKESVHDMELPEGNDPESRKMRRLIRNRLSAQLHRERKREALDSLRAEVEERDEKIKVLEQELKEERLKISTMESEMDCVKNYYGYDVIHAVIKGHHHHTLLRKHQPSSSPELVSTGSSSSSSSDEESTLSPASPQRSLDSDTEIMTGLLVDDEEVGAGQPKRKRKRFSNNHSNSNNNRRSGNATVFMLGSMALCGFIAFFNAFTSPDYYYAGYNGAEHGNLYNGPGDSSTSSPSSTSRSVWNLLGCLWNDYDTNVLGPEFHHPSAAPHVKFIPHYNNKNVPKGETFRSRLLTMVTTQFFSVSNTDNTNNDSKKKEGRSLLMNKNPNYNYHFISPVESQPRKWNLSHGTPWVAERENPLYNAMKSKLMKQNNNNDSSSTSKMMNPVSSFLKRPILSSSTSDEKKTPPSSNSHGSSSFIFSPYVVASLSTELEDLVANEAAFRSGFDLEDLDLNLESKDKDKELEDLEVSSTTTKHKDLFKNDSISPQYLSFLLPASRLAPGYFFDDHQEWVELGMEVKSARILENVDFLSMEEDEEGSSNVGSD